MPSRALSVFTSASTTLPPMSSPTQYRWHAGPGNDASAADSRLVDLEVEPHCPLPCSQSLPLPLLPHGSLQPVGDPIHGDACQYDQHQQRYQAAAKPTAAVFWGVIHAGSIVAWSGGFKCGMSSRCGPQTPSVGEQA